MCSARGWFLRLTSKNLWCIIPSSSDLRRNQIVDQGLWGYGRNPASFHVFTRYVKMTFFRGTSLRPVSAGGTVHSKDAHWIDIHEGDELDEAQMATWVQQAAALPGWVP
jgi:hypothetical protein